MLRRYAGPWCVWGLAVSAVISGLFSGWSQGLLEGGFGGMLVALLLILLMYLCLCCSLGELAAAMPFAGGAYAYARAAFGPWGGFLAGLAQIIEYVLSAAVIAVTLSTVTAQWLSDGAGVAVPQPVLWVAYYALFTFLNAASLPVFFGTAIALAIAALGAVALFVIEAPAHFDLALALDVPVSPGGTPWLPAGVIGVAYAVPFAVWFILPVEQGALAAEETVRPDRVLPKALLLSLMTVGIGGAAVLILNSGIPPGARVIAVADEPLRVGLNVALGDHLPGWTLALLSAAGMVASFHAVLYGCGRSIFAMARGGYLPGFLGAVDPHSRMPRRAIIAGAVLGLVITGLLHVAPRGGELDDTLLNMAVFGAFIAYAFQLLSFVQLRRRYPGMRRPYASPLGVTGAVTGVLVAATAGLLIFSNHKYHEGLFGCAVLYGLGAAYFAFAARSRLSTVAPEERFARDLVPVGESEPLEAAP